MFHDRQDWKRFNINDVARVKLTAKGIEVLKAHWIGIPGIESPESALDAIHPKWREGIITIHLWNMAQIFGEALHMGGQQVFDQNVIDIASDNNDLAVVHSGQPAPRPDIEALSDLAQRATGSQYFWSGVDKDVAALCAYALRLERELAEVRRGYTQSIEARER